MRFDGFRASVFGQFSMAFCYAVATVMLLLVMVVDHDSRIALLCFLCALFCGYVSIGYFINGKRRLVNWWRVKVKWKQHETPVPANSDYPHSLY